MKLQTECKMNVTGILIGVSGFGIFTAVYPSVWSVLLIVCVIGVYVSCDPVFKHREAMWTYLLSHFGFGPLVLRAVYDGRTVLDTYPFWLKLAIGIFISWVLISGIATVNCYLARLLRPVQKSLIRSGRRIVPDKYEKKEQGGKRDETC